MDLASRRAIEHPRELKETLWVDIDGSLVDTGLEIGDGKSVRIAKRANCGRKIKAPNWCGEEMSCSV